MHWAESVKGFPESYSLRILNVEKVMLIVVDTAGEIAVLDNVHRMKHETDFSQTSAADNIAGTSVHVQTFNLEN